MGLLRGPSTAASRTKWALAAVLAAGLAVAVGLSGCTTAGTDAAAAQGSTKELTGDFFTHDPALVAGKEGGPWFVYSTGNGQTADGNIQIRRSEDGKEWTYAGEVWQKKPEWLKKAVPGVDNLWAPELYEHNGIWYLYYSASTFGKNNSVIALATNTTLDPEEPGYQWVDKGEVISSGGQHFNAIDAGIVEDDNGTPWMAFGSFWTGIQLVELKWPGGLRANTAEPVRIADRKSPPNAIEAPYILPRDGYYYLFVSRDFCCQGLESTYNIAVGRSEEVTGPYIGQDGVALLDGGGTPVLTTADERVGPGGQSVSGDTLAFHYYDAKLDGAFRLGLLNLQWVDGWPVTGWD
ncbi:arabinan endo-1,5-alpha-L-arabinosidase [Arthrobacter sp. R4-81]